MLRCRAFARPDMVRLLELDQGLFPTPNPVTLDLLQKWINAAPRFCLNYVDAGARHLSVEGFADEDAGDKVVAFGAAVPLKERSFNDFVRGRIVEGELDSAHLYDGNGPLCVHLYHIEVLDRKATGPGLIQRYVHDVARIAKEDFGKPVHCFSSYSVTYPSIRAIERLGGTRVPTHDGTRSFLTRSQVRCERCFFSLLMQLNRASWFLGRSVPMIRSRPRMKSSKSVSC